MGGELVEITDARKNWDDRMAQYAEIAPGKNRKYLPYLMVNMLGRKPQATPR